MLFLDYLHFVSESDCLITVSSSDDPVIVSSSDDLYIVIHGIIYSISIPYC